MKKIVPKYKLLFFLVLICLIVSIVFTIFDFDINNYYKNKFNRIGYTDFDVNGVIFKKYIDKKNHLYPTIKVKDSNGDEHEFILNRDNSNLYSFVEVNDSIKISKRNFNVRIINSQIDTNILISYNY